MKKVIYIISTFITLWVFIVIVPSQFHHDGSLFLLKATVREYCDFDLYNNGFELGMAENGEKVLFKGGCPVITTNEKIVISEDTCFLKMVAFQILSERLKNNQ